MRLPIRSETDAFRFAYGFALVIGISLLLGYGLAPLWGIGFFTAVALGLLVWDVASVDPERRPYLTEAAEAGSAARDKRRILVIANEALAGKTLREELLRRGEPRPVLEVVAPMLPSRTHLMVSDIDREREEAQERLEATLAWAREQGFEAEGQVGDPNDPLAAIGDELRLLGAEELIIANHPPERANWLEYGILEHVRNEIDIPITQVVVDRAHDHVTIQT